MIDVATTSASGASSPTSGTVESADGTTLTYHRLGDGPPLVVCHGAFAAAEDWMPVAQRLAATHTVYVYDRRGRGGSPYQSHDFAVDAEVDDLATVVALAGANAAILGHSFGGGCALALAARDGLDVPVIVYEPRHAVDGPASGGHLDVVENAIAAGDRDRALRVICDQVLGLPAPAVEQMAHSPVWGRMLATVDAFGHELRFLDTLDWKPGDLTAFTGPCWELVGELTPALPGETAATLPSVLPQVQTVEVPNQSHFAYMTDPELLASIVTACLEGTGTDGGAAPSAYVS